jgi:hypothetical protein
LASKVCFDLETVLDVRLALARVCLPEVLVLARFAEVLRFAVFAFARFIAFFAFFIFSSKRESAS